MRYTDSACNYILKGQVRQNILKRALLVYGSTVMNAESKNKQYKKTFNAKLNTIQTLLKIGCK